MARGVFIVFEGLDRAGKSTQVTALCNAIGGIIMKFPYIDSEIGKVIQKIIDGEVKIDKHIILHLLFSANRWELQTRVEELLNQGINVIMDRYAYSGVAYSMAKGLPEELCKSSDTGLLKPDLVVYIDINPEIAAKREGYGRDMMEKVDFQVKVRECYQKIKEPDWLIINGEKKKDVISNQILDYILNHQVINKTEIGYLWREEGK